MELIGGGQQRCIADAVGGEVDGDLHHPQQAQRGGEFGIVGADDIAHTARP
jgi:hypothetical protein